MISPSQRPLPDNTQHSQQTNIHVPGGIRNHNLSREAAKDLPPRPRGHWDRPCAGIGGFESPWRHGRLSLVIVLFFQVEVSVSDRSFVQRSPTECSVSEFDREAWILTRPWPTRGCCDIEKNEKLYFHVFCRT